MPYQIPKPADALETGDIFQCAKLGQGYFIVTDARYGGGCEGHDPWPDAWTVQYMPVPNQSLINVPRKFKMTLEEEQAASKTLSQNSPFSHNIPSGEIKKVAKMKRSVTVSYDTLKVFDPTVRKRGSLT